MNKRDDSHYQLTMSLAKRLLRDEAITEDMYRRHDENMRKKYKPVYGALFTDIALPKPA